MHLLKSLVRSPSLDKTRCRPAPTHPERTGNPAQTCHPERSEGSPTYCNRWRSLAALGMTHLREMTTPLRMTRSLGLTCLLGITCVLIASCSFSSERGTLGTQPGFKSTALQLHNQLRKQHSAPPLAWDNTLAHYAEQHALTCQFKHSHGPYGENLAAGHRTIGDAIHAWYVENKYYSYEHPQFSVKTGHFTQLVWVSSNKLGCAFAICDGKNGTPGKYYVCEYSPPGNVINPGFFARNVIANH